jgi:flagellar biosynthesis protein FlhG
MSAQLWVVAAGKGGVGKTFTASSIAITLSKLNYKVLVVDFDTSGANLHSSFGLSPSKKNLLNYFQGNDSLDKVIMQTQIPKLSIIQGFWDSWSAPQISVQQARKLALECKETSFDYVVFDMGPGANPVHLEMFHLADEKILISNAEPTSVEKNYRFIEAFICHSLKEDLNKDQHLELFKALVEYRQSDK